MGKRYWIPKSDSQYFDALIDAANSKIKANLEFIQKEDIRDPATIRTLVADYSARSEWATKNLVYTKHKYQFKDEKEYRATVRHLEKWTDPGNADFKDPAALKEDYYKSIIRSLTTVAIENNVDILDEKGNLPKSITNKIKGLTLEQMRNWFDHGDVAEHVERNGFNSKDFLGVDREEFIETFNALTNNLQTLFPNANQRKYNDLKKAYQAAGKAFDRKAALRQIYPQMTPGQMRYYAKNENKLPSVYKPPRKRKK